MKVIVCGAGQVGFNIARHLALENNDVTVVDNMPDLVRQVGDTLDARAVIGHASLPEVLEEAGAADTDMLIAVTHSDEVNMVACQVAHSLFEIPKKIARIRQQSYLEPMWSSLFTQDNIPIDVIISPEMEVARAVSRRLKVPGTFEMISLVDDKIKLLGVRCRESCPLLNTPLRQLTKLFPDLNIVIVGIMRDDKAIVPSSDDQMLSGDEVYFVVDSNQVNRAMTAFGYDETEAHRVLIFGGGNIGFFLARELENQDNRIKVKIIESNTKRARFIAQELSDTMVINGDVLDPEILEEVNIQSTETVVAVTNDDETNILGSLLAKRYGTNRTVALINKGTYEPLINSLGIDAFVSPRNITVSTILQHVRRGRIHSVHALREGFGELIEAEALETSELVGIPLREIKLPGGVVLGAIVRKGEMICPGGSTVIEAGDRVVLFAAENVIRKVEQLFSVQIEYF